MKTKIICGRVGVIAPLLLCFQMVACFAQSGPTPLEDTPKALSKIEPRLQQEIQDAARNEQRRFLVVLNEAADVQNQGPATWKARGEFVYERLRTTAEKSQARLRRFLKQRGVDYTPFWIINAISVTGNADLVEELARQPEVQEIRAERIYRVPEQITAIGNPPVNGVEWNIDRIGAKTVWDYYGTRGEGIVVCNIDSGVQFDHPALRATYRGNLGATYDHNYNWFGPPGVRIPRDDNGHGTHTMGTMVGDAGPENRIGVAPGARWIAAQGFTGVEATAWNLMACAQWVLAPTDLDGNNPRPDLRPNIVNNSWGGDYGGDSFYRAIIQQWIAAGIFPVFSAGNMGGAEYGSYCSTIPSPGDYPECYTVTAFDISDHLAYFASTGPGLAFGVSKPNVAAPGLAIRSSYPGNLFAIASGTSMAAPHVAGAVALLWSAAPALKGDVATTRAILDQAAINTVDLSCGGTETNNYMWGEGRLDISMAVSLAPRGPTGLLQGGVTNAVSGLPVAGATVRVSGPMGRTAVTDTNGLFAFAPLMVGTYELSVQVPGYLNQTNPAVNIESETPAEVNFLLEATTELHALTGTVYDSAGAPVPGAQVTVVGLTNEPAISGADGAYSIANIPPGTYEVRVAGGPCLLPTSQTVDVSTDVAGLNLAMTKRYDAFGYGCEEVAPAFVRATTPLMLNGDDFTTNVALPFSFPFYGKPYKTVYVSGNGALLFDPTLAAAFDNFAPPTPFEPNAGIYVFWDDMYLGSSNRVYSSVRGIAPNREFIIEWRNLYKLNAGKALDMEVILRENGDILTQYTNVPNTPEMRGASATFGLENETGTVGFNLSSGAPVLNSPSFAVRYRHPAVTLLRGQVRDANDLQPIRRATIRVSQPGGIRELQTDENGVYSVYVLTNGCSIEASAYNYSSVSTNLALPKKSTAQIQDFLLPTSRLGILPGSLRFVLATNQTRTLTLTLTNTGSSDLNWSIGPHGGYKLSGIPEPVINPNAAPDAPNTRDLYLEPSLASFPAMPGDILQSWAITNNGLGWGIGLFTNGNLWVSDATSITNSTMTNANVPNNWEFTSQGIQTGRRNKVFPPGAWGADMAYDSRHGLMCQVMVGGAALSYTSSIVCWNPETGAIVTNLAGTWSGAPQKGLAYRPDDDTFYIGGWPTSLEHPLGGAIIHIKGLSHAKPGEIVIRADNGQPDILRPADASIAGLAWDPERGILWQAANTFKDNIYALSPTTGEILATLSHPKPGYNSAGLETDGLGRLWVVGQIPNVAYLINTGVDLYKPVSWLSWSTTSGTIGPASSQNVEVTVDSSGFGLGEYAAELLLQADGGKANLGYVEISANAIRGSGLFYEPPVDTPSYLEPGWYGMRFKVASKPFWVVGLGRMVAPDNTHAHVLKLVNATTGEDVPGGEVTIPTAGKTTGQFSYAYLPSPVALQADATYYLVSQEGSDDTVYSPVPGAWPPHSDIVQSSVCPAYQNIYGDWVVDPGSHSLYGPVNFLFGIPRSLTLSASNAQPDIQFGVAPLDTAGNGDTGIAQPRTYSQGTKVMLTAPPLSGDKVFQYWSEGGNLLTSNRVTTVNLTSDRTVTAVYGNPLVAGFVVTSAGKPVSGVQIAFAGETNPVPVTALDGKYVTNLLGGFDYVLTPSKADDTPARKGVTSFDVYWVQRHILGLDRFSSPQKFLAADVDHNGTINTFDVFFMRRLILALTNAMPAGLWRFVPADYYFPDPENPWLAPEVSVLNPLISNIDGEGFVALKLGDVDLSWPDSVPVTPSKAVSFGADPSRSVRLAIPDSIVSGTVQIPVYATATDLTSMQFSLRWDPSALAFAGITHIGLLNCTADNFNEMFAQAGVLPFSWDCGGLRGVAVLPDQPLFVANFRVLAEPGVTTLVTFQDEPTPVLASLGSETARVHTRAGNLFVAAPPGNGPRLSCALAAGEPVISISLDTEAGITYVLEAADSLENPEWKKLAIIIGNGLTQDISQDLDGSHQRFFRIRLE